MTESVQALPFSDIPLLVEQAFAIASGTPQAVRIEIPIEPLCPLKWLHAQNSDVKTYWADRQGEFIMAGIGAAHVVDGEGVAPCVRTLFERIQQGLSCAQPSLRYYGGVRFDATRTSDPRWRRFGTYRFLVPRFELLATGSRCCFVCNAFCEDDDSVRDEVESIRRELADVTLFEAGNPGELPRLCARDDRPSHARWRDAIDAVLKSFGDSELEKVVLAREAFFEFSSALDPISILRRLSAAAEDSYLFLFQAAAGSAFLGASPERLYRRVGGFIQSEALAGTRPRGNSDETDAALGDALLHDDKELREHGFVADSIRSAFSKLCRETREEEETSLVRLQDCQHLVRRFEGILTEGADEADILETLHPTPAVGGCPVAAALERIALEEPFDRGWYAGPIGWIGYESSEFAVGIRSGLVDGKTLSLYAGAGIVPGSEAEREWNETESKLETFSSVLTRDV